MGCVGVREVVTMGLGVWFGFGGGGNGNGGKIERKGRSDAGPETTHVTSRTPTHKPKTQHST